MTALPGAPAGAHGEPLSVTVADQVKLRVRHWPGPAAPAFVLVHGLSSNARLWDGVARRLARAGHAVYAVDLRGHGESDTPAHGYDTATAAADLASVCTHFGLSKVVVAGHSWGAGVAVRIAVAHPELVSGITLVEGGWNHPAAAFHSWEECAAVLRPRELGGITVEGMRSYLRTAHPDWSPEAIDAGLANLRSGPDGSLAPRLPAAHHMSIVRSMWDDPPARWFSAVTVPALLLPAIPATDVRVARWVRELVSAATDQLPQATVREYPGADHDLHAQQPDRVAQDLLRWAGGWATPVGADGARGRDRHPPMDRQGGTDASA